MSKNNQITPNQKYLLEKEKMSLQSKGFSLDRKKFYFWSFFFISVFILVVFFYKIYSEVEKGIKIYQAQNEFVTSVLNFITNGDDTTYLNNPYFQVLQEGENKDEFTIIFRKLELIECNLLIQRKNWISVEYEDDVLNNVLISSPKDQNIDNICQLRHNNYRIKYSIEVLKKDIITKQ